MSRMRADTSDNRKYNLSETIQLINQSVLECYLFKNYTAIPDLVELLETNLIPYIDKKYSDELKTIMETGKVTGRTRDQIRASAIEIEAYRTNEKHRALMKLAFRHRFLPSASTGNDVCYIQEGEHNEP